MAIPAEDFEQAIKLIDEAHAEDPNIVTIDGKEIPYELHYAQKMTDFLKKRAPDASPELKIAIRAQHFRRWQIPRTAHPPTRTGYLLWRTKLKTLAASQVSSLLAPLAFPDSSISRIASLIRKEDLKNDEETQALEDVACLVFLDDQFEAFEKGMKDEEKVIDILRKTWGKMSEGGRELVGEVRMSERGKELVGRALGG